jgi:HEAT repeat protein
MLKDTDETVRLESLTALEKIGPDAGAAIPTLVDALKDSNFAFRLRVAELLASLGGFRATAAVDTLIEAFREKDEKIRQRAVVALRKFGPEASAAIPPLMQALKDADGDVRQSASEALANIGKPAIPSLLQTLNNEISSSVRIRACWALGEMGAEAKEAVSALRAASSEDRNFDVRKAAKEALRKIQRKP